MSLSADLPRAGALLFVRSLADVPNAIRTVNELLSRRSSLDSPGDDVLGVVVQEGLDGNVPKPPHGLTRGAATSVRLRESAALVGLWSLCWFELTLPEVRLDAEHRRSRLLDLLLVGHAGDVTAPDGRCLVLPVLSRSEARKGGAALVHSLSARYPMFAIGPHCFVHDVDGRRLVPLARLSLTEGLRLLS